MCFGGGEPHQPVAGFEIRDVHIEEGQTGVVLRVKLDAPADARIEIRKEGPARPGRDFILSETSLVFHATGPVYREVVLDAPLNGMPEGPRRARLVLAGGRGYRPGEDAVCHIGIRDADSVTVMAANLTSGRRQQYREPGKRLMRGLMPDVVGIQEFRMTNGITRRAFVDEVFGAQYEYVVEADAPLPCGIISRWPIRSWGVWEDPGVGNRNFVWAIIDIPGSDRHLQAVSAHFLATGSATDRRRQAERLKSYIREYFDPEHYVVIAADLNTRWRGEMAMGVLDGVVTDGRRPADQAGNENTNRRRNRPYDYVLPCRRLDARHHPHVLGTQVFTKGLVFDSRLWEDPPHPIRRDDSGAKEMQHMPVIKTFAFPEDR